MFDTGIPHEYPERIKFLQEELKALPEIKPFPKYGLGAPFPTFGSTDNRRKKMFQEYVLEDDPQATEAGAKVK